MKSYLTFLLLFLTLSFCSCDSDSICEDAEIPNDEAQQKENTDEESSIILNFLGDSIIEYWKNIGDYFPQYECFNYGWSRQGIDTFLNRMDVKVLEGSECVVEIGTNDMRNVINANIIDEYVEHYIDVLISWNAKRIYLLSLLPRNRAKDGSFDYNSRYPEINAKIQMRALERMDNVIYIPLYDIFLKEGQINWDYTYDGLHPNTKGYEIMARVINSYLNN